MKLKAFFEQVLRPFRSCSAILKDHFRLPTTRRFLCCSENTEFVSKPIMLKWLSQDNYFLKWITSGDVTLYICLWYLKTQQPSPCTITLTILQKGKFVMLFPLQFFLNGKKRWLIQHYIKIFDYEYQCEPWEC